MANLRVKELEAELQSIIEHKKELFFKIGCLTVQVEELKVKVGECKKRVDAGSASELEKEWLKQARKSLRQTKKEIEFLTQKVLRLTEVENRLHNEIYLEKHPHLKGA